MARRTRTIINSLRSLKTIREANKKMEEWWNPSGHPEPELPSQEYLEGEYLSHTVASNPHLREEAQELVSYAGGERLRE